MSQASSGALTKIAPVVFSLFLGGVGGYFFHSSFAASAGPAPAASGARGGPSGSSGPMAGGGRGGGGGGQPSSGTSLSRTVRGLAMLEKVQNRGLTAEQTQKLLPIAQEIQASEKLPEKEAAVKLTAMEAVLTDVQKQAISELQPARGGRGGGGGMGGGMPGSGGRAPGSGGGGMPGGGGGAPPDPDKPFASERNKKGLEDLLASLKQPPKP